MQGQPPRAVRLGFARHPPAENTKGLETRGPQTVGYTAPCDKPSMFLSLDAVKLLLSGVIPCFSLPQNQRSASEAWTRRDSNPHQLPSQGAMFPLHHGPSPLYSPHSLPDSIDATFFGNPTPKRDAMCRTAANGRLRKGGECRSLPGDVEGKVTAGRLTLHGPCYFPVNSFFTISLTTLPSTRMSAPWKRAITFFITVPMSFMVGAPISAMTALTPAATSASLAALGR